jgi:lipoprotein-anchoring transpeptidase ErfK/SrfK
MTAQSLCQDRRGQTSLPTAIPSLLIAAAVTCAIGLGSILAFTLAAAVSPQPALAAPLRAESAPIPVATLRLSEEPTPAPLNVAPEVGLVPEAADEIVGAASAASDAAPHGIGEYRVKKGDTLAAIALANGTTVADLVAANSLADPDLIFVGQEIVIPARAGATPVVDPTTTQTTTAIHAASDPTHSRQDGDARWIDVDLSEQRLSAYEGNVVVRTTLVSTGLPETPTPVGEFNLWIKLRYDDMAGPGYYIEDVPFVMYFHEGYGIHGVTWHGNFGHPMSHGCVNLPTPEAEWLFGWAQIGTLVRIHH